MLPSHINLIQHLRAQNCLCTLNLLQIEKVTENYKQLQSVAYPPGVQVIQCTGAHTKKKKTSFLLFISHIPKPLIFNMSDTIKTKLCYPLYPLCFCNSSWAQVILNMSCKKTLTTHSHIILLCSGDFRFNSYQMF